MLVPPPPIKIICKVCCWEKVLRPQEHDFVIPNCAHCGSQHMTYMGTKSIERVTALFRDMLGARLG